MPQLKLFLFQVDPATAATEPEKPFLLPVVLRDPFARSAKPVEMKWRPLKTRQRCQDVEWMKEQLNRVRNRNGIIGVSVAALIVVVVSACCRCSLRLPALLLFAIVVI